jgi:hypothetical protein
MSNPKNRVARRIWRCPHPLAAAREPTTEEEAKKAKDLPDMGFNTPRCDV